MARRPKKKGRPLGLRDPLIAAVLGGLAVYAAVAQERGSGGQGGDGAGDDSVFVNLPAEARQHIRDWPAFIACYNLAAQDAEVAVATLRANGFPAQPFPTGAIRVVLKPTDGRYSDAERQVLDAAEQLRAQQAREGVSCLD